MPASAPVAEIMPCPSCVPLFFLHMHRRKEGKRTEAGAGQLIGDGRIGINFALAPEPAWLLKRLEILKKIKERNAKHMAALEKPSIGVTMPDGSVKEGTAWETTPLEIAASISEGLKNATVVASVRYSKRHVGIGATVVNADREEEGEGKGLAGAGWVLWDASRPLEGDCEMKLHKFEDPEGKEVFWHSSAHVLGEALESLYSAQLTHGPALESGFFYDAFIGINAFNTAMQAEVEKKVKKICEEKQPFERVLITKADAQQLFAANPFKLATINSKLPDDALTTVYQCGPFVDLCRGPHLPTSSKIKAFAVQKTSASLWLGQRGNDELQRIYGITFPDKKQMAEWKHFQEEAAKRDHRVIGIKQELFFFDELSPGSCFFLPHGGRLYLALCGLIREQYWQREYMEVITPNMYNINLWHTSGHAAKYKENMFLLSIENQEFGFKPMNCPGHCIMFKQRKRSYRELPWRLADFGVLHRNEISGALTGLTRVRRFQQDDGHIFCTPAQIKQEVANVLDMIMTVYVYLGMEFSLKLSTRPENALGEFVLWERAESLMIEALKDFEAKTGRTWSLNPGDGAFYGPKIDVQVFDALKRPHQCATVQLDFVQPIRFDLKYQTAGGDGDDSSAFERPVALLSMPPKRFTNCARGRTPCSMPCPLREALFPFLEQPPPPPARARGYPMRTAVRTFVQIANPPAPLLSDPTLSSPKTAPPPSQAPIPFPTRAALPPPFQVMIHRAVLGSVERMIAILTEHYAGKWPFFLSPRQCQVVPVSKVYNEFGTAVRNRLRAAGFYCDVDLSARTLNKMVREAQVRRRRLRA